MNELGAQSIAVFRMGAAFLFGLCLGAWFIGSSNLAEYGRVHDCLDHTIKIVTPEQFEKIRYMCL